MDYLNKFCLIVTIIFVFAFIINPPWHKIFRNEKTYRIVLYISIFFPIVAFLTLFGEVENPRISVFVTFYPLIFLILYRHFDNLIFKKFNRHIIFQRKYNVIWKDDESDYATSSDSWYQFLICFIPIVLSYGIGWFIFEIIKYYC